MPVKLKTTPYLTRAGRNVKSFLAILATISFAVIVIGWTIGYLRAYLKSPVFYNPLFVTENNLRFTSKLMPPLIICDAVFLLFAAWNLLCHWNMTGKLRSIKSTRHYGSSLTQAQVSALDRIAVEYVHDILGVKSDMARNIWNNLKPDILDTITKADKNAHIDLKALIKAKIAAKISGM